MELSQDGPGLTELSRDAAMKGELHGEPAPNISELSSAPERSPINTPKRVSVPVSDTRNESSPSAQRNDMQPSLRSLPHSPLNEGGNRNGRTHVMSWMDYDADIPSPAK